ncbi:MAG: hypothetical protein MJK18_11875, partial [Bdellovibrionales bacterium]|nr:hypothetical protein [Bdellovibrionales bacterium]
IYDCEKLKQLKKTLNHYVNLDTDLQVWKLLELCNPEPLLKSIKSLRAVSPEIDLHVAFSKSQMLSKMWLCNSLKRLMLEDQIDRTLVLCGWYGVLPALMFHHLGDQTFKEIRSIDIDEHCEDVADAINKEQIHQEWKFKASTGDIYKLDYERPTLKMKDHGREFDISMDYNLLVNTSCEHLENFDQWYHSIPDGSLLALQSNNFFELEEHVNCHKSIKEFEEACPMKELFFSGELPLEKYTRYMVIGRK